MRFLLALQAFVMTTTAPSGAPLPGASCPIGGGALMVCLTCPPEAISRLFPHGESVRILRGSLDGFDATTALRLVAREAGTSPDRFEFVHAGIQFSGNGVRFRHVARTGDGFLLALQRDLLSRTTQVAFAPLVSRSVTIPAADTVELTRQDMLLARLRLSETDVVLAVHALGERAAYPEAMVADQKRLMDDVRRIPPERWAQGLSMSSSPDSSAIE
jgi:hypothetical protein